jgi:hypothetical protein
MSDASPQPPPPPDVPPSQGARPPSYVPAGYPHYGYPQYSAPIPVEPLEYSLPSTRAARTRPGVLTLVGVLSIGFACLGVAGGLLTLGAALYFSEAARAASAAATATARQSALPSSQPPAIVAGPAPTTADGLDEAQRREAIRGLGMLRRLRPERVEQLDAILARAGRRIFDARGDAESFGFERARAAVLDHGQLFTGNRRAAAPEYFKTTTGRLELYDDRAVFYPDDGSPAVRSAAVSARPARPLNFEQVQALVNQAHLASGEKLNEAQKSALLAVLSDPSATQQLVTDTPAGALKKEPRSVTVHSAGGATVHFSRGELHLGRAGELLPTAAAASVGAPRPSRGGVVAVIALGCAGAALAVLLFVAAVLVLRGSRSGRTLHLVWAVSKIIVTISAASTFYWLTRDFARSLSAYADPSSAFATPQNLPRIWFPAWQIVLAAVLGCLYPLLSLLLLWTPGVREYFRRQVPARSES